MVSIPPFVHVLKPTGLGVSHLNKLVHMKILGRNQIVQNGNGSVFSNTCAFQNSWKQNKYSTGFFFLTE